MNSSCAATRRSKSNGRNRMSDNDRPTTQVVAETLAEFLGTKYENRFAYIMLLVDTKARDPDAKPLTIGSNLEKHAAAAGMLGVIKYWADTDPSFLRDLRKLG